MLEGLLVAVIIGIIIQFFGTGVINWFDERAVFRAQRSRRKRLESPEHLKRIGRDERIKREIWEKSPEFKERAERHARIDKVH